MTIRIINLSTCEQIDADEYALRERGLPEGFRLFDEVTKEELWEMIRELQQTANDYRYGPDLVD